MSLFISSLMKLDLWRSICIFNITKFRWTIACSLSILWLFFKLYLLKCHCSFFVLFPFLILYSPSFKLNYLITKLISLQLNLLNSLQKLIHLDPGILFLLTILIFDLNKGIPSLLHLIPMLVYLDRLLLYLPMRLDQLTF